MLDVSAQTSAALLQAQASGATENGLAAKLKRAKTPDQIEKIATDFEAMFLSQMLAPMFDGIKSDGPFGGGHGEDMFRSMLYDHYAKELAAQGGLGVADQLKAELLRQQEAAATPSQN